LQISEGHLARSFNPSENAGGNHIKKDRGAKHQTEPIGPMLGFTSRAAEQST
jgi:hypothetical protein